MATHTYWYEDSPIWVVEHAGHLRVGDLLLAAHQTRQILHRRPLFITVDMTEVMYTSWFIQQALRLRPFDAFLNASPAEQMAFVIPGTWKNRLYHAVKAHQDGHQRTSRTRYYDTREEALDHLLQAWAQMPTDGATHKRTS